jgi:hypothetical protein
VKLFKRWRHARSMEATSVDADPVVAERVSVQPSQPQTVPRGRRPSTMGKTLVEQSYLADAARRAKQAR